MSDLIVDAKPITVSRFKKLQETGLEAELFFIHNFNSIESLSGGVLEDARLFGDGYDFQISVRQTEYLVEVKGVRERKGTFRMTEKEYHKAIEYENNYLLTLVLDMNNSPVFRTVPYPARSLNFKKRILPYREVVEYYLIDPIC